MSHGIEAFAAPASAKRPQPVGSAHARALRRAGWMGLVLLVLFCGTVGLWAATSKLSGAVMAPAQFVVDSNLKKVQHPTGGVVGELRVREGDPVSTGDLLIRLDETVTRANLQIIVKQLDQFAVRRARLEAERDGAERMQIPPELADRIEDLEIG